MNELLKTDREKNITVYRVEIQRIRPLRHRLLRAGLPPESAHFAGDNDEETWHVGAFSPASLGDAGTLVCCASFMMKPYKEKEAWQLRGMCTDPQHQGCGIGSILLKAAIEAVATDCTIRLFWCNARAAAVRFYEKQGWIIDSEEFDIPTAGPHRQMIRRL